MAEHIGTTCVQGGYRPGDAEPRQVPIYQSTTWKYDTSEHMGRLFDLEESGYFYTRLQNPTNDYVAAKIAELEGGTAAMLTSSGQAANFFAVFNIAARETTWWQAPPSTAAPTTCSPTPCAAWAWSAPSWRLTRATKNSRRRSDPTPSACSARPSPTLHSRSSISNASPLRLTPTACR
mgnify:CR=1 FL=1